jgi:hypothetical protein
MIDRIVHHADVLTLKGAIYRLRNRGPDRERRMELVLQHRRVAIGVPRLRTAFGDGA